MAETFSKGLLLLYQPVLEDNTKTPTKKAHFSARETPPLNLDRDMSSSLLLSSALFLNGLFGHNEEALPPVHRR